MQLTKAQASAMLKLGENPEVYGFIEPHILDELEAFDLIVWRTQREVEFTAKGRAVYEEFVDAAEKETVEGSWVNL